MLIEPYVESIVWNKIWISLETWLKDWRPIPDTGLRSHPVTQSYCKCLTWEALMSFLPGHCTPNSSSHSTPGIIISPAFQSCDEGLLSWGKKNLSKSPWSFYGFWNAEYTLRLFVHMLITEWHIEKKLSFNSSFWDPLFGFGIEWDPSVVHEVYNVKADPSWSSCYTTYPWKGLYWHRIWVSVTHAQDQRINVSTKKK